MNILLGLTGSVATTLHHKLYEALSRLGNVHIVVTQAAIPFIDESKLPKPVGPKFEQVVYSDNDEWTWRTRGDESTHPAFSVPAYRDKYRKNDPVLHIDLCKWANVLVIAPCSANTLAKICYGMCDNLLCSIVRAWPDTFPLIVAPAMNVEMWDKVVTDEQINRLEHQRNFHCIDPISKKLACGDTGIGAMANIEDIVAAIQKKMRWAWPFHGVDCPGVPVGNHPGSFGFERKHNPPAPPVTTHTGVDLYVPEGTVVHAMQEGKVLAIEHFTGPQDNSPWWLDTDCILLESASGVICYGEIEINPDLKLGGKLREGDWVGKVKKVVKTPPKNPPYGHKPSMLHVELYDRTETWARAELVGHFTSDGFDKSLLRNPTEHLLVATGLIEPPAAINATGIDKINDHLPPQPHPLPL